MNQRDLGPDSTRGTQERGTGHERVVEMDKTSHWISVQTPAVPVHPQYR